MNDWRDLLILFIFMGVTEFLLLQIYKKYNLPKLIFNKVKAKTQLRLYLMVFLFFVLVDIIWIEIVQLFGIPHLIFIIGQGVSLGIFMSIVIEIIPSKK